jgi:hypothetical protein
LLDAGLHLSQPGSIAGGEHDRSSHKREAPGNGLTDAASGARDYSYLAG